MEKSAIVTGASSGIGLEIARELLESGYDVYGFGRDFTKCDLRQENEADSAEESLEVERSTKNKGSFYPIEMDLLQTGTVCEKVKEIRKKSEVSILVNCAGCAYYGLHEELNPKKIQEMVRTNLELPLILSNQLLRELKKNKGYIFQISSVTAKKASPHGAAYGATKAGLSSFSESLFEEVRKYGVKVIDIRPDMTDTDLYRNADFKASADAGASLMAKDVAKAVSYVLKNREGVVVSELCIKPQLHRIEKKQV